MGPTPTFAKVGLTICRNLMSFWGGVKAIDN